VDNIISFSLMAEHGSPITYNLTFKQFIEFRCLIQLGGEKTIGHHRLAVSGGYLNHYKKSGGQPSYSIELDGALDILDRAEIEARKTH